MANQATLSNMTDEELIRIYSADYNPVTLELCRRLELALDGRRMDIEDGVQMPLDFTGGGRDT